MQKPVLLFMKPMNQYWERLVIGALDDRFEIISLRQSPDPDAVLAARGHEVIAALTSRIDVTQLDQLPNLRLIVVPGAGYENVAIDVARTRGIMLANPGDTHSGDVADHAVALTLASVHRLNELQAWVREGRWSADGAPEHRHSMSAQRFGMVGLGNIGNAIAERLVPFGGEIAWWGPHDKPAAWPRQPSLIELAHWCTALIVATRGDAEGLIDADTIAAVGPQGLIVNITRGLVIDEDALIAALRSRRLGHAALDVFEDEPTPPQRWKGVPNAILTPHVAGDSHESMARLRGAAIRNLQSVLDGGAVVHEIK